MFVRTTAHNDVRSLKEALADEVATAIEEDAKTTFQIALDAGIVHSDLLQWLGTTSPADTGPFTKHQNTIELETAAAILTGLSDDRELVLSISAVEE